MRNGYIKAANSVTETEDGFVLVVLTMFLVILAPFFVVFFYVFLKEVYDLYKMLLNVTFYGGIHVVKCVTVKFELEIHGPLRMNCNNLESIEELFSSRQHQVKIQFIQHFGLFAN